ncbi:MAG: DUF3995 domain-containing protein [Bacteroidota bacterium]
MYQAYILSVVFISLSILHFYWASGGKWWLANVLPKKEDNTSPIRPGAGATIVVGLVLLGFGSFYIWFAIASHAETTSLTQIISWIIPSIFLLRAIGDFKYVGFFKRIRHSSFSKYDNRLYSPLCLTLAMLGVSIASQL